MKGKKIYIDVWATWCGPCLKEHELSGALRKILKEKDIQLVYISIDQKNRDSQWKELIKYYNLEGSHIRANENFTKELLGRFNQKTEDLTISIPWYILIDEEGNIIREHAKRPSQIVSGEDLFEN